jgi:hypothetical protein
MGLATGLFVLWNVCLSLKGDRFIVCTVPELGIKMANTDNDPCISVLE